MTEKPAQNVLIILRRLAIAPVLAALAACVQVPQSPTAGPGPADAIPSEAGRNFAALCINTLPTYAGAEQVAASLPLTRNAGTGTLYHNSQNLSYKLTGNRCSMVAGTTDPDPLSFTVDLLRAIEAAATVQDADVGLSDTRGPDGKFYITASTRASN